MSSTIKRVHITWVGLISAGIALELIYLRMHNLYYLKNHAIGFIELALAAGILYLIALYGFTRTHATRAATILLIFLAIAFRASLWTLEPTLSDDLHRYRWEGKVQAHGLNPYTIAPNDPRLASLRDYDYQIMPGPELPAIYPPASELVFRAAWAIVPGPVAFKIPFELADVLAILVLAWIFRHDPQRNFRVAVYAWNPLVIVEFAGSSHNDVLAILGIVCALAMFKKWPSLSVVPVAFATMAKVFPAVLLPVWIRRAGWPQQKSGWWAVIFAALFCALAVAPYWRGLSMFRANFTYYEATFKNYHASLYTLIDWVTGGHTRIPALVGLAASWGLALYLSWRRSETARAAYLLIGTILAFSPNGYSWYFTWIVPLLCFFPNPAWLLLTILQFLSYNVLIGYGILGVFHFDPFLQWLVYLPFYVLLIANWFYRRWHRAPGESNSVYTSAVISET